MSHIYVIGASYGEWDSFTSFDICCCALQTEAQLIVEELERLAKYNREFCARWIDSKVSDPNQYTRDHYSPPEGLARFAHLMKWEDPGMNELSISFQKLDMVTI